LVAIFRDRGGKEHPWWAAYEVESVSWTRREEIEFTSWEERGSPPVVFPNVMLLRCKFTGVYEIDAEMQAIREPLQRRLLAEAHERDRHADAVDDPQTVGWVADVEGAVNERALRIHRRIFTCWIARALWVILTVIGYQALADALAEPSRATINVICVKVLSRGRVYRCRYHEDDLVAGESAIQEAESGSHGFEEHEEVDDI
jgi:hypothetical protein